MRSIFDDLQMTLAGKSQNALHVARLATEVNRNDGFGLGSERCRQVVGSHIQGVRLAVDEDGFRSEIKDHLRGRPESHRRENHLVPPLDSNRRQREVKSRGSGINRHSMTATDELAKASFKLLDLRSGRQRAGL